MAVKKLAFKTVFTMPEDGGDSDGQQRAEVELRFSNPNTVVIVQNHMGAVVGVYQKSKK